MLTLDDRITFLFDDSDMPEHDAGMYPYVLYRNPNTVPIFVGNFYYNGIDTAITFDVTDIIASDGFVIREDDFAKIDEYSQHYTHTEGNRILNRYYVKIMWDEETQDTSYAEYVAKVYKYRNRKLDNYDPFFNTSSYEDRWSVIQVGNKLTPHYPMSQYSVCPLGLSLLFGSDVDELKYQFKVDDYEGEIKNIEKVSGYYSLSLISSAGDIGQYSGITPMNDGEMLIAAGSTTRARVIQIFLPATNATQLYVRYPEGDFPNTDYPYAFAWISGSDHISIEDTDEYDITDIDITDPNYPIMYSNDTKVETGDYVYNNYNQTPDIEYHEVLDEAMVGEEKLVSGQTVAIFDVCPKKYYLFWQDRFGGFQCQGFSDYANYSEAFDTVEVQDYQNRRRNANVKVQPKWSINSGWISEDLYPYYESIYTSPILYLYDTELNQRFSVMVTGDYTEKTYRNQKKMINMSIELQENKKQNIIY